MSVNFCQTTPNKYGLDHVIFLHFLKIFSDFIMSVNNAKQCQTDNHNVEIPVKYVNIFL